MMHERHLPAGPADVPLPYAREEFDSRPPVGCRGNCYMHTGTYLRICEPHISQPTKWRSPPRPYQTMVDPSLAPAVLKGCLYSNDHVLNSFFITLYQSAPTTDAWICEVAFDKLNHHAINNFRSY
jgi:hypothetical protein